FRVVRVPIAVVEWVVVRLRRRGDRRAGERATDNPECDPGAASAAVMTTPVATAPVAAAMPISGIGSARRCGERSRGKQRGRQGEAAPGLFGNLDKAHLDPPLSARRRSVGA